jgi:hypothetical protein
MWLAIAGYDLTAATARAVVMYPERGAARYGPVSQRGGLHDPIVMRTRVGIHTFPARRPCIKRLGSVRVTLKVNRTGIS